MSTVQSSSSAATASTVTPFDYLHNLPWPSLTLVALISGIITFTCLWLIYWRSRQNDIRNVNACIEGGSQTLASSEQRVYNYQSAGSASKTTSSRKKKKKDRSQKQVSSSIK